jgi:hypothetical protein
LAKSMNQAVEEFDQLRYNNMFIHINLLFS